MANLLQKTYYFINTDVNHPAQNIVLSNAWGLGTQTTRLGGASLVLWRVPKHRPRLGWGIQVCQVGACCGWECVKNSWSFRASIVLSICGNHLNHYLITTCMVA